MAFFTGLATAIVAALSSIGVTATVATVVTTLNTIAISIVTSALSLITSLIFSPKPKGIGPAALRTVRAAVENARWVIGERKVGGALVGYHVNTPDTNDVDENGNLLVYPNADNYLHLVFAVSEGACESVDGIWIDGEFFDLVWKREAHSPQAGWDADMDGAELTGPMRNIPNYMVPVDAGKYENAVWVKPYFNADGITPAELHNNTIIPVDGDDTTKLRVLADKTPAATQSAGDKYWQIDGRMEGISYIYVILRQADYISKKKIKRRRQSFSQYPELHFRMKGIKFTWPGQLASKWTRNAAAVRYWWLVNRLDVDPTTIPLLDFQAAYDKCEEIITLALPTPYADYVDTDTRYNVDGVIFSDDTPIAIEDQMDLAWQGNVIFHEGEYLFRPGTDRTVSMDLVSDDLTEPISTQVSPALQDRVNTLSMTIDQSKEHEYSETALLDYIDNEAVNHDQQVLEKPLGTVAFINSPIRASAMMVTQVRRARAHQHYTISLRLPDNNMPRLNDMLDLKTLDVIRVNETTEHGLVDKLMRIAKITESLESGMSKVLNCEEYDPDFYEDTLTLPPIKPRILTIENKDNITLPANLTVLPGIQLQNDGSVLSTMEVSWNHKLAPVEFQYRTFIDGILDNDFTAVLSGDNFDKLSVILPAGLYEYRGRHYSYINNAVVSAWTAISTVIVLGDLRELLAPTIPIAYAGILSFELRWPLPAEKYYGLTVVQQHNGIDWVTIGSAKGSNITFYDQPAKIQSRLRIAHRTVAGVQTAWSPETTVTPLDQGAGTKGDKGDMGDMGLPGIPGVDGNDGQDGTNGIPGIPGVDGNDGQDGAPGVPGIPGLDGADGQDGAQGTPGLDGEAGCSYERVYTAYEGPFLPVHLYPDNNWVYGSGGVVGTQVWVTPDPPSIDENNPYLLCSQRETEGCPANGTIIADTWSTPVVCAHFGLNGLDGQDGVDGEKGDPGTNGNDGAPGVPGIPGVDGTDGQDGAQGDPGENGRNGLDGTNGVDGQDGVDGTDGQDGVQGPPGTDGVDGQDGAQGDPGENGRNGLDGTDGQDGADSQVAGPQGIPGTDGAQGPQGEIGETGAQGPQGEPGNDGVDGNDGAQGPPGNDGVDGNDGAQGIQGPKGDKGDTGDDSTVPGPQGIPGLRGSRGLTGEDGQDGTDGQDGADGTPGGPPGPIGPQGPPGEDSTVPGPPGEDACTFEYVHGVYEGAFLPANLYPNNDWVYGSGGVVNGFVWTTPGTPNIDQITPFLLRAQRKVVGCPTAGTIIPAPWSVPGVIGHYGLDGLDGDDGADSTVPGPTGPRGSQGPRGVQGPQGDPGQDGISNIPGPQGPQGDPGTPGEQGDQGTPGVPGGQASLSELLVPLDFAFSTGVIPTTEYTRIGVFPRFRILSPQTAQVYAGDIIQVAFALPLDDATDFGAHDGPNTVNWRVMFVPTDGSAPVQIAQGSAGNAEGNRDWIRWSGVYTVLRDGGIPSSHDALQTHAFHVQAISTAEEGIGVGGVTQTGYEFYGLLYKIGARP